jgi:hypothetical protein
LISNNLIPFEDDEVHSAAPGLAYDSASQSFTIAKCLAGEESRDRDCAGAQETKIYTVVVEITRGDDANAPFQPIRDYRFAIVVGSTCNRDEIVAISSDNIQYTYPIGYRAAKPNFKLVPLAATHSHTMCPLQCSLHTVNGGVVSAPVQRTRFVHTFDTFTGDMTLLKAARDDGHLSETLKVSCSSLGNSRAVETEFTVEAYDECEGVTIERPYMSSIEMPLGYAL